MFLRGWEEFDEPVDRIVSIEAFEAFPKERYAAFFEMCHRILPSDGRMVLQTILGHPLKRWPEMGIPITMTDLKFMRFIAKEIFPGGAVPCDEDIVEFSGDAGFSLEADAVPFEPALRPDTRYLGDELGGARDDAIAVTSDEVYERYMRYLTGCADFFRRGISEVGQFTLSRDSPVRAEHQRDVVPAESEGIGDRLAVIAAAGTASHDIEIDLGVEVFKLRVGGTTPSRRACTVSTASTAPAAPSEWPNAALGAYTAGVWSPSALSIARASARSPKVVPVAWALMWSMSAGVRPANSMARVMASPARSPSGSGLTMS